MAAETGATAAWWTFVAALAVAVPIILVKGRDQWFVQDEWAYLAARDGGSLDGLFAPHNQHWSTVPVAAYRLLWNVVGLRSYLPYQVMIVALHLAVVVLVRAVMRRAGVGPWVATAAAVALLLYGTGHENLVWAIQVGFAASLALGLGLLLLADDPEPSAGRRVAAFACGVGALASSGVGLTMVGVVGLTLLVRRGWRPAAVTTAPLALVYLAWWAAYGRESGSRPAPSAPELLDFVDTGLQATLRGLGQSRVAAVLLVLATVGGLAVACWATVRGRSDRRGAAADLRHRLGPPVAMAVGAVAFFALSGFSRAAVFGAEFAAASRYSYVAAVLLLPLIAVAIDAIARRWPLAVVPGLALLVVGIPGTVEAIEASRNARTSKDLVLTLAHSDLTAAVDRSTHPFANEYGALYLTAGWLHDGAVSGRIPAPADSSAELDLDVLARLALQVAPARPDLDDCALLDGEQVVELGPDDAIGFWGALVVRVEGPGGELSTATPIGSLEQRALTTAGPPLTLHLRPRPGSRPGLCR